MTDAAASSAPAAATPVAPAAAAGSAATRPARPVRAQHVFVVERTERLSPHLVRVHLGGEAFDGFVEAGADQLAATDRYVKLLLPPRPHLGLQPPFDLDELRGRLAADELPVRRTYTIRSVDADARTIAVDFVVHGDEGVAGPWALAARPGDLLQMSSPGGLWSPSDDPDLPDLLLGDDSAVPAIASALESMGPDARGLALIEVEGRADELELARPEGVELRWLHRAGARPGSALLTALRGLEPPTTPLRAFAHGERGAMKEARVVLHDTWGLDRSSLSLSAYWALGRVEDAFQAEKREPVGALFAD
ncbi:siderophore-interacting protein [Frigoribacterium sp. PvP032]|uniref:siderophore-interacting protein n=1 Tax=Frigoribacterium sp. PvP032 TaxID=2806589 RepID=UPI001AE95EBB|nr:siderophore-interacting protein [Frigoribacterium sp. PvP032]MBP1191457.1 NADPH-dependent ferric siderophore reductase [Frigoribacterium sp. PvP032]